MGRTGLDYLAHSTIADLMVRLITPEAQGRLLDIPAFALGPSMLWGCPPLCLGLRLGGGEQPLVFLGPVTSAGWWQHA